MTLTRLPDNLPKLLRDAGLEVVEIEGWQDREVDGPTSLTGVLNHHTGASAKGWSLARELEYAKWMFLTGRPDLSAPLCQIALGRSGKVYIGAAGRANHAGDARPSGSVSGGNGNTLYVGIEWMLSGTEAIPAAMTRAGITLNAVLTAQVLETSVRTISCHYQTSVTGKWDIGDPLGIPFNGHRVLDVDKFRLAVAEERERLTEPTLPPPIHPRRVRAEVGHFSGQFSDNPEQWRHDLEVVMSRGYDWITGTEAGESDNWTVVRSVAAAKGYTLRRFRSNWIAIHRSVFVPGSIKSGDKVVVDNDLVVGHGHDTSYVWLTFTHSTPGVGKISITASHYPTKGRPDAKDPAYRVNLKWTRMLGRQIGEKMRELGKGKALSFYGGDQNITDKENNTFFHDLPISCWDEIQRWPGTGHGNIDVVARSKKDGRVKCIRARAFTDKQLFLYSDHYLIQAVYEIRY